MKGTEGLPEKRVWFKRAGAMMAALGKQGAEARFVGGCVRDALLGREAAEVDIAIDRAPEEVMRLLEETEAKVQPIGVEHGTVRAQMDGLSFEITSLRVDLKTDGRHAEVAFTKDWQADAERRDFTINALYADADGTIHDPLGGRADLAAGRVLFIGDASARLKEDYLRILRFFRFHAAYGKGEPDAAGLKACVEAAAGLERLSAERIAAEMIKLLKAPGAPGAASVLRVMAATGLWQRILPEGENIGRFERLRRIEEAHFLDHDAPLCLAALFPSQEKAAKGAERLKLAGRLQSRIAEALSEEAPPIVCYLSMREMRRMVYRTGQRAFCDRLMIAWAGDTKASNETRWRALLAMAENWEKPVFPLTGEMIKAAGVPQGPETGRVMKEVENWWIDADFTEDRFSVIERLKAVVQATIY